MSEVQAIMIIVGSAIITQGLRYIGLSIGGLLPTTGRMGAFLNAVPIAILTGLAVPTILNDGYVTIIGALITAIIAFYTRNMLIAMLCGIISVVIVRQGILF